jgi:hypothetical protein
MKNGPQTLRQQREALTTTKGEFAMAPRELPDQETLRKLLDYDPQTGALTWRERPASMFADAVLHSPEHCAAIWNKRYAGKAALCYKKANGYLQGSIFDRKVHAHRVAFKWMMGVDPDDVDHIDGDRANNRFENLRNCSRQDNLRNMRLSRRNVLGVHGVRIKRGRWNVRIGTINVGTFDSFEDAAAARKDAEQQHGYHENHGR